MLKPWEYLFKTHILARGWDYYENGAVSSLRSEERRVGKECAA